MLLCLLASFPILGECLRQLEIYQPWANGFEAALVDREKGIQSEFAQRTSGWGRVLEAMKDQNMASLSKLGAPSDGMLQYPVGKRRNKANIEAL